MAIPQGALRLCSVAQPRLLGTLSGRSDVFIDPSGCVRHFALERNRLVFGRLIRTPVPQTSDRDRLWNRAAFLSEQSQLLNIDDFETDKRPVRCIHFGQFRMHN